LSFQHIERIVSALEASAGGVWKGRSQLDIYWLVNIRDVPIVKAAREHFDPVKGIPSIFVVIKELPRGALVEKQTLLHTGRVLETADDEEDEPTWTNKEPCWHSGWNRDLESKQISCSISFMQGSRASCIIICIQHQETIEHYQRQLEFAANYLRMNDEIHFDLRKEALSIRLFYKATMKSHTDLISAYNQFFSEGNVPAMTSVPCRFLSNADADDWDYALCIIAQ
jgi:diphthine-ammonia ligase